MDNSFEIPVTQEGREVKPSIERFEAIREFCLPVIRLGEKIPQDTVDAVQHAALVTLHTLGVSMEKFKVSDPGQLVDVQKRNAQNLFTYERLPDSDMQVPVLVVSSLPLYDFRMRETIALYEPENAKIFLNLRKIKEAFKGNPNIDQGTMAGIVAVEEVIHFVQDKYWHRESRGGNTDYQAEEFAQEHDADPLEEEASRLKKQVFDELYPELQIKVRGIDY